MRDPGSILIEQLIVHIVDPRGAGLVLSAAPLPLAGQPELQEYFTHHISDSISNQAATAARFREIDPAAPSGLSALMLSGSLSLVEGTREMARRLYRILDEDRRTKGADLAICFYSAENHPGERFLALLKLDASQVFRHRIETDALGLEYVNFVLERDAFTREKLQKSAFIRRLEPRHEDYDMILLDRQVADRRRRDVAHYFAVSFLAAEDAYDARERTALLYRTLVNAANELRSALSPEQQALLDEDVQSALKGPLFNLEFWLDGARLPAEPKAELADSLRRELPVYAFSLDPQFGSRLVRKRVFRGDHGLQVQVMSRHFNDMIRVTQVTTDPLRPAYFRVVIETEQWDEVV